MIKNSFPRGFYEEQVADFEGVALVDVTQKENKVVALFSSCVGAEHVSLIKIFDEADEMKINISSPQIVKGYNVHRWSRSFGQLNWYILLL